MSKINFALVFFTFLIFKISSIPLSMLLHDQEKICFWEYFNFREVS